MDTDQKKRTLEAIERKFALAKCEFQQQQQMSRKWPQEVDQNPNDGQANEVVHTVAPQEDSFTTPVSRKGNVSFVGYTPGQDPSRISDASKSKGKKDVEANDLTYSEICLPVHDNLLNVGVKLSRDQIVDNVLHELFQNGDAAARYRGGLQKKEIEEVFPLDSFVQKCSASAAARAKAININAKRCKKHMLSAAAHAKAIKIHAKRCKKHMSMKQHRKCGSFDLPQEFHRFEIFEKMHEMWKDYILKLTKNIGDVQKIAQRLLSADLHGAILRVVECKVSSYTGVNGIMVRETAETFGIITRDNKFRVVPKRVSVFMLRADCWKITLQGDKLTSRKFGA